MKGFLRISLKFIRDLLIFYKKLTSNANPFIILAFFQRKQK